MFERRDTEHDVERSVAERQFADVGYDAVQPRDVAFSRVDADHLAGPEARDRCEPRRLGERVADVEEAARGAEPSQDPGKLDRPLVDARRRRQLVRALVSLPCGAGAGKRTLEGVEPPELVARDEVSDNGGARRGVLAQRGERCVARIGVRGPTENEAIDALDEVLVRERCNLEIGRQPLVHGPILGCA